MRATLEKGVHVQRYYCRFCGQAEVLTDEEEVFCSNCGLPLEVIKKPDFPEVTIKHPILEEELPKEKKKPGRKPRPKIGTCGTCEKALKAEFNYTCKETCEMVYAEELACKHYKHGVPVGERPGASYTGNERRKTKEEACEEN